MVKVLKTDGSKDTILKKMEKQRIETKSIEISFKESIDSCTVNEDIPEMGSVISLTDGDKNPTGQYKIVSRYTPMGKISIPAVRLGVLFILMMVKPDLNNENILIFIESESFLNTKEMDNTICSMTELILDKIPNYTTSIIVTGYEDEDELELEV